jgi:U3 small nucleolar RNA-associated protein 6
MAELVQASLEGMLTELEQMQRVELLGADEVREVIKRRQRFEYKMQKRQKKKEDILAYIQYECALLELIELRREKIK